MIPQSAIICLIVVFVGVQAELECYNAVKKECAAGEYAPVCTSSFGNFPNVVSKFQQFTNTHILRSWQALLIGKHYANYQLARPGFHSLFVDFSETMFDKATSLIRYINNRGSTHNFEKCPTYDETNGDFELYEYEAIAWITDISKKLAQDAQDLDVLVGGTDRRYHDGDAAYYLRYNFSKLYREFVRTHAGFHTRLARMQTPKNQMLILYDFDNWLSTQY